MNNYLLVLRFENAGIFPKYWKEKEDGEKISGDINDRIFSHKSHNLRNSNQWIDQKTGTFHHSFIENVIRVLVGVAPISKYRSTCIVKDPLISEMAKRSFVKIDSFIDRKESGEELYVKEKFTIRKCLENSWAAASPSWIRFKYLLPEELYNELVTVANDICKCNAEEISFSKAADKMVASKDKRVDKLIDLAKANSCGPLVERLTGSKANSLCQAGYRRFGVFLKTLVVKSVSDISRLDGKICIPITQSELKLFENGNGTATIFDGGVVLIENVINLDYTTIEAATAGYKRVQL